MATVISKDEALAQATALLGRAMDGEEIVVEQIGARRLRLVLEDAPVPLEGKRVPGTLKGLVSVPPSFWEPLPDEYTGWPKD